MKSFSPGVESEAEEEMTCHHEPGDNTRDRNVLVLPTELSQKGRCYRSVARHSSLASIPPIRRGGSPDQGWREFRPSRGKERKAFGGKGH